MSYNQLKPFNQSTAGTIPKLCLSNVRLGYQIPPKYPTAWEAWLHTEQHTNRDVPEGVDVPLYYRYTATLDGLKANYGHINVRLANGTIWSDGRIFPSIEAYEAWGIPEFVGWGESVNNVKVIEETEGEEMSSAEYNQLADILNKNIDNIDKRITALEKGSKATHDDIYTLISKMGGTSNATPSAVIIDGVTYEPKK